LIVDIGGKIRVEGATGGEVISPIPGLGPHRELISMLFDQDLIASELHVARQRTSRATTCQSWQINQ
jgi:hypothetical protein